MPAPAMRQPDTVSGCMLAETTLPERTANCMTGGDHVDDCALPGFDARYLAPAPGFRVPDHIMKTFN